jgi:hypothetical protein
MASACSCRAKMRMPMWLKPKYSTKFNDIITVSWYGPSCGGAHFSRGEILAVKACRASQVRYLPSISRRASSRSAAREASSA